MNGKALVVDNADFSAKNLGRVTFLSTKPLIGITISVENTAINEYKFSIAYNPSDTYQKGVIWSITNGESYGTITSDGVLTLDISADNSAITVKAESVYNSSITATHISQYTYIDPTRVTYIDNLEVSSTGEEIVNPNAFTSDFIAVTPLTTVIFANNSREYRVLEYKEDKATINDFWQTNMTITLKATTKYLRVCQKKKAKNSKTITITDSNGDYIYYHPKTSLFGKYIIDFGEEINSFIWTMDTSDTDTTKSIEVYSASGNYIDFWGRSGGTKTCRTSNPVRYVVMPPGIEPTVGDKFTVNGTDFTEFTYNTTIY